MKLSFTRENGQVINFQERLAPPPVDESDYIKYRVKDDCHSPYWSFHPRIAAPAPQVNPTSADPFTWPDTVRIPFTEDLQYYHANNLSWRMYGKPFSQKDANGKRFTNLTREEYAFISQAFFATTRGDKFFTDRNGTDLYADFINGRNLNKGLPKWQGKLCGKVIVWSRHSWEPVKGIRGYTKGKWMRRLVALRGAGPFPDPSVNPLNEKYIFDGNVINKNCTIQQFPQLTIEKNGVPIVTPVPFALLCVNQAWYPESEMEEVA